MLLMNILSVTYFTPYAIRARNTTKVIYVSKVGNKS